MRAFQVLSALALIAVSNAGHIGGGYGGGYAGHGISYVGISHGDAGYGGAALGGHGGAALGGHGGAGIGGDGGHDEHVDYYAHPKYTFDYSVKDPHTGDNKNQWEHRDGDVVKGSYSIAEADGTTRIVEYTSDKHNGFNAIVKRIGHAVHPQIYGHEEPSQHGHY